MQTRSWGRLAALAAVALLVLGLVYATAGAAPNDLPAAPARLIKPAALPAGPEAFLAQSPRQILSGNLTVERGQVIDESVLVYAGNVAVKQGGRITGALVVWSGHIDIEEGASVDGDVTAYAGNIKIKGRVGGNVAAMSGNIELDNTARVEGDVSVLSGRIRRADGAYVGGNLVQTPGLLRLVPSTPNAVAASAPRTNLLGRVLALLARLIAAALLTGLVAVIAGLIYSVWPVQAARTRATLMEQKPLSFVVGLFGNLTLLFLAGLLSVTICLLPLALVPMLALLAVNLFGWTVISQLVGERVAKSLNQEVQPLLSVAVGAVLLTGIASLLWAFGGCFRLLAFLFLLGVSSFGAGAVVVPWLNRRGAAGAAGTVTPGEEPPAPAGDVSPPPTAPAATADVAPSAPSVVESPAPAARVAPEAAVVVEAVVVEDEFTRLRGVGPVIENKLKEAGLRTFAQLAAASPEQIADILGWTVERVQRSEIREQAQRLVASG